jgi:hypothetical protein
MTDTYLAPDGQRYASDVERTPEGLQTMLAGVKPQSMKDKLDWLIAKPMQPRKQQKPCDIGLFDLERRQQLRTESYRLRRHRPKRPDLDQHAHCDREARSAAGAHSCLRSH